MKKFYTMALALTVVASAMAAPQIRQMQPNKVKNHMSVNLTDSQMKKVSAQKVKAKAGEEQSIEGYYDFHIGDYYFEGSLGEQTIGAYLTLDGNTVTISSDSEFFVSDITGTYDATTNKLSFDCKEMGSVQMQGSTYYIKFATVEYTEVGGKGQLTETPIDGTYDPATGTITFPIDHAFGWKAYSAATYAESSFAGWLDLWDVLEMKKGIDPESGWNTLTTTAKWMDYMVWPMFMEAAPSEKEITVQQAAENPNMFRMVAPFADIFGSANIVLDATDRANVLIALQESGIVTSNMGPCYIASTTEILADPSQGSLITMNGNRIEFPIKSVWLYFPQDNEQSVYFNGEQTAPGYLIIDKLNGIDDIAVDHNAPIEYFNLQGVRIANPEKGQLVITRQGSKTSKTIVR